jgi:lipoprotein NlpI
MYGPWRCMIWACSLSVAGLDARWGCEVSGDDLISRATAAGDRGDYEEAVRLAAAAVEGDPKSAAAYRIRGRERFRAGQIRESIQDFDQSAALRPDLAPRQWERGIACYYAGMYEEGVRQFESYQKFDSQDVENSVWRFLCLVPQVGVQRAQATMLPIENDRRVPMMQVYDLYRGRLQPADVLSAVRAGEPPGDVLAARHFYAHLYLGLWYEVNGDQAQAARYIELASDEKLRNHRGINAYMWDVARIHRRMLRGELKPAGGTKRP